MVRSDDKESATHYTEQDEIWCASGCVACFVSASRPWYRLVNLHAPAPEDEAFERFCANRYPRGIEATIKNVFREVWNSARENCNGHA